MGIFYWDDIEKQVDELLRLHEKGEGRIEKLEQENIGLREEVKRLKDFAIWMTGCGYDFTQHEYFRKERDELLKEQ